MAKRFMIKIKYTTCRFDKDLINNHKMVKKQLLDIFPMFQQFKVEIRGKEEWILDWDALN